MAATHPRKGLCPSRLPCAPAPAVGPPQAPTSHPPSGAARNPHPAHPLPGGGGGTTARSYPGPSPLRCPFILGTGGRPGTLGRTQELLVQHKLTSHEKHPSIADPRCLPSTIHCRTQSLQNKEDHQINKDHTSWCRVRGRKPVEESTERRPRGSCIQTPRHASNANASAGVCTQASDPCCALTAGHRGFTY